MLLDFNFGNSWISKLFIDAFQPEIWKMVQLLLGADVIPRKQVHELSTAIIFSEVLEKDFDHAPLDIEQVTIGVEQFGNVLRKHGVRQVLYLIVFIYHRFGNFWQRSSDQLYVLLIFVAF